jgi:hypothetical protein
VDVRDGFRLVYTFRRYKRFINIFRRF